jgi:hypothetical protein
MPTSTTKQQRKTLKQYKAIQDSIGVFLSIVADAKNPEIFDVIDEICNKVDISTKSRFMVTDFSGAEVGMPKWFIIETIKGHDGITMHEIADISGLSLATVSRILKRLLNDGAIIESGKELHKNRMVHIFKTA